MGAMLGRNDEHGDTWPKGVDPDLIDPDTGLTPRDRRIISRTFSIIVPRVRAVAIDIFVTLFTKHPEHQKLFPQFADLKSAEDLRRSKRLTAHASTAAHALAAIVECIGDTECLMAMLTKLGDNHKRHHVTPNAFVDFKEVLMEVLKRNIGSAFTTEAELAWNRLLTFINQTVTPRLK